MFIGAIPEAAQRIVRAIVSEWPGGVPVQVICSGNLTVERSIAPLSRDVRGNDVTLYSCLLGAAASGGSLAVTVRERLDEAIARVQSERNVKNRAAALLLILDVFERSLQTDEADAE